jgi:hypothetical protein
MATTRSGREWTEATWNPTVGCTKVSPGCDLTTDGHFPEAGFEVLLPVGS